MEHGHGNGIICIRSKHGLLFWGLLRCIQLRYIDGREGEVEERMIVYPACGRQYMRRMASIATWLAVVACGVLHVLEWGGVFLSSLDVVDELLL